MPILTFNITAAEELFGLGVIIWLIVATLVVIIHLACAIGILMNGEALARQGRRPVLVGLSIWAMAALLGGIFVLTAYWIVHHSTLNPEVGKPFREHRPYSPGAAPAAPASTEPQVRNQPAPEFDLDELLRRDRDEPPQET